MQNILKRYFGFDSFRPLQEEIIRDILTGRDVVVLMPTGGGKSLCYQIPALMMEGTAVVISPLISLMRDQVESLRANGVSAAALNSMNSERENVEVRAACLGGRLKLLYVSPERLLSELPYLIKDMKVSLFAVDEAHCISQWGHDFRPEYAQLGLLRQTFPTVPIAALTATADRLTREDIQKLLGLRTPAVFVSSFDRPNLSLDVRRGYRKKDKDRALLEIVARHPDECGIVYCLSKKTTEGVAEMLCGHDISAVPYHAGLSTEEREKAQEDFVHDRVQVVCATVAFGMGIDKSDVRFVVHYNLPKSIEGFYQEIGRAGRDGLPAETVLFYSMADWVQLSSFAQESGRKEINMEKLNRMREYAESEVCRRRILLNYFGEQADKDCGNCDVCKTPPRRFDGTILAQKALSAIVRAGEKAGARTVTDILRGNFTPEVRNGRFETLKTFGAGREVPQRDWQDYLMQMLQCGLFEIAYEENNHLRLTESGRQVLYKGRKVELAVARREERPQKRVHNPNRARTVTVPLTFADGYRAGTPATTGMAKALSAAVRAVAKKSSESPVTEDAVAPIAAEEYKRLFEALRTLRKHLAEEQNFPPYIVMSDKVLKNLCEARPLTVEAFGEINGIGEFKKKKYGKDFVDVIRRFK